MKPPEYPQLTFRLSTSMNRDLAMVARIRSRTKSECVREALKIYCKLYIGRSVVEEP
jgi:predicted DNA-binding protein